MNEDIRDLKKEHYWENSNIQQLIQDCLMKLLNFMHWIAIKAEKTQRRFDGKLFKNPAKITNSLANHMESISTSFFTIHKNPLSEIEKALNKTSNCKVEDHVR